MGLLQQVSFTSKMLVDSYDVSASPPTPTIPTFQAMIALFDEHQAPLMPARGKTARTVGLWASVPVTLTVNGQSVSVGDDPTNPTTVSADTTAQLQITCPAGISAPNLCLKPDFFPKDVSVTAYPDTDNLNRLANVQATDLDPSSALDYSGAPILISTCQDSTSRTNIASAIRNAIGQQPQAPGPSAGLTMKTAAADVTGRSFTPGDVPNWQLAFANGTATFTSISSSEAIEAIRKAGASHPTAGFFSDLEHFVDNVVNGAEALASVVWNFADGVVNLAITGAENTYKFSLQTVEDAVQVATGIVKQVVTAVSSFLEWLSYLFQWDNIVTTHTLIQAQVNSAMGSLKTWIDGQVSNAPNNDVGTFFTAREKDAASFFSSIIKALTGQTMADIQQIGGNPNSAFQANGQDVSGQSQWLVNKVNANAGSTPSVLRRGLTADVDFISLIGDFFTNVGQNISTDPKLANFVSNLQTALTNFSALFTSSSGFLGQALADVLNLLNDLVQLVIQLASDVAQAFLVLLQGILDAVVDYLTTPLTTIPFVSDFYAAIAGGDQLTPLSLFSLIIAVPTTIVYELVNGTPPPAPKAGLTDSAASTWLGLANTFLMLLLIPLWIASDLTSLPAPLSLAIAAATLISLSLGFAVLDSTEVEDFVMLCAEVAAVAISVYGIGVSGPDQEAWAALAPTVYGAYGLGMVALYCIYAGAFPANYFAPDSETMFANIASVLPYLGQPLNYIKADDVGPAAVSLVDFFGYGTAAALNTIENWSG